MYHLLVDFVLVWCILLLGRDLYKAGGSPFFAVVNETLKVFGLVGRPLIKVGAAIFSKGLEGASGLFLKFLKRK